MTELRVRVRRLSRIMCYLLALFVLGWGFTDYKTVFAGLILGTVVSFFNALYTAVKVRRFGQRVAQGRKPGSLGMLTRFSLVGLAALIAIRYADIFHVPSLAIGLFLTPAVLWVDGLIDSLHNSKKKGGENHWNTNHRS